MHTIRTTNVYKSYGRDADFEHIHIILDTNKEILVNLMANIQNSKVMKNIGIAALSAVGIGIAGVVGVKMLDKSMKNTFSKMELFGNKGGKIEQRNQPMGVDGCWQGK